MANRSNEGREQRIMKLRRLFELKKVVTVCSAMEKFGYSRKTIVGWCRSGNIPLVDTEHGTDTIVPLTKQNCPKWLK